GPENLAVAVLIVLAWLRVAAPSLVHMFTAGRPAFNSPDAVSAAADALGDAISLAFIAVAAALAASGIWRRTVPPDRPAGTRRPARLLLLAVVLAPLISIALAGLRAGQVPGLVSLALPLAAVAVWLRPPEPRVLATIGVLGAVTAAGSVLMALVRPDLALLSGAAAGAKTGMPGGLLAGPYPHSNVLGISLALSLPFVLHIGHNLARRGCLAAVLLALAWTGSRTAQLAAAAVLLSYLLIRRHPARIWPLVAPVVAGAVLIVALPLFTRDPDAFTDRGRIWQALLDRWADRPLLGWGPDVFDRPELAGELGGRFNHGHNVMVHLLVIGGLITAVLFAGLLYVAWRQSLAFARAGMAAAALFLVALVHVSWLEASHVSTTLAGYLTWLPLVLIVRLGPAPPAARARRADGSRGAAAQKMTVSRM
ncbi:MAG TPA: O-antigen ligase family protein, partial [Pilimelia sp.]|nr:O-antigen ligase family protein [Pilimelia sp.]